MKVSNVSDAVGTLLVIALVTTILKRGSDAAAVIRALGESFSNAVNAAQD